MTQKLRKWDPETIRLSIRKLQRAGVDLCSRGVRRSHGPLYSAAIHWFGSYRSAVAAAGLDYDDICHKPANHWSKREIIAQLRKRRGRPMHHAAMEREMPALVVASYRYFGNYRKAVEAAGMDYTTVRVRPQRVWNPRRIIKELRHEKKETSGLWQGAMKRKRPTLLRAAQRYFGSYPRAARAAGIDPASLTPPPFRRWSPNAVLDALRARHRSKEPLNPTHLREKHPYLIRVSARRFGSYRKAVTAAGIDYASVARLIASPMPASEVISRLTTLHERGKDLRYTALERTDSRLLEAARRRFGSYRAAVEAAGIAYPPLKPIRHWTEPLILKTLRELHRADVDLRYSTMKKNYLPLYEACRYYYGFYTNAVREAGIDYSKMVEHQLQLRRKRKSNGKRRPAVSAA